jgi:hypothetical protein
MDGDGKALFRSDALSVLNVDSVGLIKPDLHFASAEATVGKRRFLSKNPKSICKSAFRPAVSRSVAKKITIENDCVTSARIAEPIKRESGSKRNSS